MPAAASAAYVEPQLPARKRKEGWGAVEVRLRRHEGSVGPVLLGRSRVMRTDGMALLFGTVSSYCQPWFEVTFDNGRVEKMRSHELAATLLYVASEFFDMRGFYFDFSFLNPLRLPGWLAGLRIYLTNFGVVLPVEWLAPAREDAGGEASVTDMRARESAELRALLLELAGESRQASTLQGLRHPAMKALWWFASRDIPLPPSSDEVALYLAYLSREVNTIGSVSDARSAIGFICAVNGWDKRGILGGRAEIPLEALRRRHAHAVRKAPGLPIESVRRFLLAYVKIRSDLPWDMQWRLALGIAIGTGFKILGRYNDLIHVRYDDEHFIVHDLYIRLYIAERKTHVYGGQWIDVAITSDGSFGVYHALLLGKRMFRSGFVLPHIDADGRVHRERPMGYDEFVRHLRQALVTTGMSEAEAGEYSAHSMRSGGASAAARAGLEPLLICHVAGVKSIDWLVGYMRTDLNDRLRASWAIGL